jgi:hypothetical protein
MEFWVKQHKGQYYIIGSWGIFDDVASPHSFRAGKLQVRSTQYWVSQMGTQHGYRDSDYRLKSGRWRSHGLQAHEIQPVHYVILSGGILWLTSYVP